MKLGTTAKTVWLSVLGAIFAFSVSLLVVINTGFSVNATATGISGINISLDEDVVVKFHTDATDGEDVKLVVNFDGADTYLTEHDNGVFSFWGVTPQNFGKELSATLYDASGNVVGEQQTTSVKAYLQNLLALDLENSGCKDALQYTAMRELAVNMLNYGSAAQVYTNTDTDALVNADLTVDQKELASETITVDTTDKHVVGDAWVGAGVRFDYRLGVYFVFQADDVNSITATINEKLVHPAVYDASKNWYVIRFNEFNATNMNDVITAKLSFADGSDQTFAYSVKSYVYAKGGAGDALANLINATYTYGFAAVKYAGELKVTKVPTFTQEGELFFDNKGYDMDGTGYETVALPALNLTDYTVTASKTGGADNDPDITTSYAFKGNSKFVFNVNTDSAIIIGGKYYSEYMCGLVNSDTVTLTYDKSTGYTYKTTQPVTHTSNLTARGASCTFIGDITFNFTGASYKSNSNDMNVGTATEPANISIVVENYTATGNAAKAALGLWNSAQLYVAKGSTLSIESEKATYSLYANGKANYVLVDGTLTTSGNIWFNAPSEPTWTSQSADGYGFKNGLYVRQGTVTIKSGQLVANSIQVGSVKDNYYGILNVTQSAKYDQTYANSINSNNQTGSVRYAFSNGQLNINANMAGLTAIDVRTSGTSYVVFDSGITVTTGGQGYTNLVGCWSVGKDYRLGIHADAQFNHGGAPNSTKKIWQHGIAKAFKVTYFDTAIVNIDGVDKEVFVATKLAVSTSATTAVYTNVLTVDNGNGTYSLAPIVPVENGAYVSRTATLICYDWSFTQATYTYMDDNGTPDDTTDDVEKTSTIYYK